MGFKSTNLVHERHKQSITIGHYTATLTYQQLSTILALIIQMTKHNYRRLALNRKYM